MNFSNYNFASHRNAEHKATEYMHDACGTTDCLNHKPTNSTCYHNVYCYLCKQYVPCETPCPLKADTIPYSLQTRITETAITAYINTYGDIHNEILYSTAMYHYDSERPFTIPVDISTDTHDLTMLIYVISNKATCIQRPGTQQIQPKPANVFRNNTDQSISTTTADHCNHNIFDWHDITDQCDPHTITIDHYSRTFYGHTKQ